MPDEPQEPQAAFDAEQLIQQICESFAQRFTEAGQEEDTVEIMVSFLARMCEVSVQMVTQEEEIKIPNTDHTIPFEPEMQKETVWMFAEGLAFSLEKTDEANIPDEARGEILQNVALYVYESAKQVVLSTFGQEHTPELQIPREQQVDMVIQTAENALNHFIAEYEAQHGAFERDENDSSADDMLGDAFDDDDSQLAAMEDTQEAPATEPAPQPAPVAPPAPTPATIAQRVQQTPAPPPPQLPHKQEKYAALALLLNVIPQEKGQQILYRFTTAEQQAIIQFQNPMHIANAGLDIKVVQSQLASLHTRFKQHSGEDGADTDSDIELETHQDSSSSVEQHLQAIAQQVPKDVLNTVVQLERPHIREYVNALFDEDNGKHLLDPIESTPIKLPKAIEAILSNHLENIVHLVH